MFYSPLRYPGGKNKLSAFIAKICVDNDIDGHYVEPYAGGASVALFLLMENFVKQITINDKDRSIYAFWHSVLYHHKQLCDMIRKTPITIEEWHKQKEIQKNKETAPLEELGFSTFFLNRTNRSGILEAGVIGGQKQTGNYLMDCRFNKEVLIKRIEKIASQKKKIKLYNLDAIDLIGTIQKDSENDNTIFYFDPPYYLKADSLYMNHYQENDHIVVSKKIQAIKNIRWIVSYDNTPEINRLYTKCNKKEFSFKHMIINSRVGNEILFMSQNIKEPTIENWNPLNFKIRKTSLSKKIIYTS